MDCTNGGKENEQLVDVASDNDDNKSDTDRDVNRTILKLTVDQKESLDTNIVSIVSMVPSN